MKEKNRESRNCPASSCALAEAARALKEPEGDGACLRDARTALEIARRSACFMNLAESGGGSGYARRLAPFVSSLAAQARRRAETERPWYPGVMLRVALDTSSIRENTPADTPLDEQFQPQVDKKPGGELEVEMTVYNWTREPLNGRLLPVLPDGWRAAVDGFAYDVQPGKLSRFVVPVTIPPDAAKKIYHIGAQTVYKGIDVRELHTHRVRVTD